MVRFHKICLCRIVTVWMLLVAFYVVTKNPDFRSENINVLIEEYNDPFSSIKLPKVWPGQPMNYNIKKYLLDHCKRVQTMGAIYINYSKSNRTMCDCVNPNSVGRINITFDERPLNESLLNLPFVKMGGKWSPLDCEPRQQVAVIIPYLNRLKQLRILIPRLHQVLSTQNLNYTIFVSEQRYPDENTRPFPFNKAMMMNIAFMEASRRSNYSCFIFHDVDFIPEDDRSMYMCREAPLHLGAYHDYYNYQLRRKIFGAVTAFDKKYFLRVNGFSNRFFGWGGEDDEMRKRVGWNKVLRNHVNVSRYKTVPHNMSQGEDKEEQRRLANKLYKHNKPRKDGLNTLPKLYKIVKYEELPLYTWILSDVFEEKAVKTEEKGHKKTNTNLVRKAEEKPKNEPNKKAT